nr:FG-GAP-like repeat-containing protein [Myxococcota bacterium]
DASSAIDGGAPDAGAAAIELPRIRRDRWVVCPEPTIAPSLSAVDLIGDASAELVVGCGDRWEVLAIRDGAPIRVVRIDAPPAGEGSDPSAGPASAFDFDGDSHRDLVLPLARYGAGGATRGGGLYVVPRDRFGGFETPRALAPIAAVAVSAGAIVGDAPRDVAVVHQANPFARLPSEVWVFSGGASPARRAVLRTGVGAQAVGLADLDRDGELDVIVTSSDDARVDVFFGNGAGVFPRRRTLSIPGAASIAIGDVDGDGADDAVIEAAGIVFVRARPASEGDLEATRIEGAPATVRGVATAQLDDDPTVEILAWDAPRLTIFDAVEGGTWESRTRLELGHTVEGTGDLGARRHLLADVDGDGTPEVILLGVSAIDGPRSLELVIVPGAERGALDVGPRREVPDAPLVLRVPLPDAQAP